MRKPKSILQRLAKLGGNLDEELARLALLRLQGKLPLPAGKKDVRKKTLRARIDHFRAMIKVSENTCWEWQGCLNREGYGIISIFQNNIMAHRLSFVLFHGREPEILVCHHCDNPKCVNPDHFFEGLDVDNKRDSIRKKRSYITMGQIHPMAKLTEEDVLEIRKGVLTKKECVAKWGICRQSVESIRLGKNWKHLLPNPKE